jgi:uroporphyrin-3 C-methyltransferase
MSEQKPPADESADNNPEVDLDGQASLSDEALTSTAEDAAVDDLGGSDADTTQALQAQENAKEEGVDTEPEPEPESSATPPPAKAKGRFLAFLALLFALAAAAGVVYLYYELVYLKPLAEIEQTNSALTSRYTELESQLNEQLRTLEQSTTSAIDSVRGEQAERLASNEDAVLASLNQALNAAPPSQREWLLAEAEYLMRVANHRVLMEQDSNGALSLLQAADQIMADLDDFALYQVRARLADEIIALRQVPRDDLQGIYLRIEAIKSQVDVLPLPEPAYVEARRVDQPQVSVWQTLVDELKQFIRVRSISGEEALKPLLAPEEERYLELNLRLSLEQAQLATLKRQQEVFEQSLLNVRSWLVEYADTTDDRTKVLLSQVDELLVLELATELPDVSGSLNELLTIRRSGS